MPMTSDAPSLTQMLRLAARTPGMAPRMRATAARRATAKLALAVGVMATAVSLGMLVGGLGRALIGG
ncbi:MAG: hypothetical protein Q8N10_04730 [Phenylobacterium sp.]|uniref:Uncharacterized protein n=1 Tax=Phenylobacterium ferrooxidans TaxID=2982689 RepID=A0ABW6CMN4_9CAUL|nr:hypothetical protein [Phenylobacterium sp.]MDO8912408.1 hypothetical protein [Phenylobacterium sp.]MDP2011654.1 hypothetical protein [Phenylobacterium sp.]MDP3099789.1 hypothetical protein [Phenylobacterium sp.]MDP3868727.1 hypothetical protein [Phenylobacterium sp.]HQT52988.1 hypothetical protein [Phenylobacterium sp.]